MANFAQYKHDPKGNVFRYVGYRYVVHMLTQCTSLLVEKADVAPDVKLLFTTPK